MSSPLESQPVPTVPPAVPPITEWSLRGLILTAVGETGPRVKGGVLDLDELALFVHRVRTEMPGATIVCHEYGLRAIASARIGGADAPKLDWSDWD